jgi:hypothetical protein
VTFEYERTMADAYGDRFTITARDGQIMLADANPYADSAVADLGFTPPDALKLARRLIKAATAAYEQEAHASR